MPEKTVEITLYNYGDLTLADSGFTGEKSISSIKTEAIVKQTPFALALTNEIFQKLKLAIVDELSFVSSNGQLRKYPVSSPVFIKAGKMEFATQAIVDINITKPIAGFNISGDYSDDPDPDDNNPYYQFK